MKKTCSACKAQKDPDEFNKHRGRKDGLQTTCRACSARRSQRYYAENLLRHRHVTKARRKERRQELRKKIDAIKARYGCQRCGETDTVCLEFHHLDPQQKDLDVAALIAYEWAWDRVIGEINKCVCLCSNCHRKLHAGRFQVIDAMRCREVWSEAPEERALAGGDV